MKGNHNLTNVTVTNKFQNMLNKAKGLKAEAYCTMAAAASGCFMLPEAQATGQAGALMKQIVNIVGGKIFPLVGGVLALLGVFKLVMAIRNDQPEAQASAARDIVIGAVMVAFGTLFLPLILNLIT